MEILNRKANFNYYIEETFECGIVLVGSEVKSIKLGNCNIKDSYAIIRNNEVFIINMFIKKYNESGAFSEEERRSRKLLLHKKQILKLKNKLDLEGYTLVPLKIYLERGKVKVLIGIGKGKKTYDKRETLKERDIKRNIERQLRGN